MKRFELVLSIVRESQLCERKGTSGRGNARDESENMHPVDPEAVASFLREMDKAEALPDVVGQDPIAFLRTLHTVWVINGGHVAGKSRNSLRQMSQLLSESNQAIRSIQPKMAGHTRITMQDAATLIVLILSHWDYVGQPDLKNATSKDYKEIEDVSVKKITDLILEKIFSSDKRKTQIGFLLTSSQHHENDPKDPLPLADELVDQLIPNSDFYLTILSQKTIIAKDPEVGAIYFGRLMNKLWNIDKSKNGKLVKLWVTSVGGRKFGDFDSTAEFINLDRLATSLRILSIFENGDLKDRWRWLRDRSAFIVGGLQFDEIDDIYSAANFKVPALKNIKPWMEAGRLQLRELPSKWAAAPQLKTLYGTDLQNIDRRTFLVIGHRGPTDEGKAPINELRYFAIGPDVETQDKAPAEYSVARGLELPSPQERYDDAFCHLCAASYFRLQRTAPGEISNLDPYDVLASLRHLGFAALKLDEFLNLSVHLSSKIHGSVENK